MKTVEVAAALIFNKQGSILIGKRSKSGLLPGLWEFPGGKLEFSETHSEALKREIFEEIGVLPIIISKATTIEHEYDFARVRITSFFCKLPDQEIKKNVHQELLWTDVKELEKYHFVSADYDIIRYLVTKIDLDLILITNPPRR